MIDRKCQRRIINCSIYKGNGRGLILCFLCLLPYFKYMEELREKRQGMGARIVLSSSGGGRVDSGALHMLPEVEEEWTILLMSEIAKAVCGFRIEEAALLESQREDRHEYFLWITSQEVLQRDPVLNTLKESRKRIQEKESL